MIRKACLILGVFGALTSAAVVNKTRTNNYDDLVKELEGIKDSKSDLEYYSEIISDYQAGKYRNLSIRLKGFAKKFPKSPFIDNAYYLAGKMALEEKNYKDSVGYFQRVISEFPMSNKVVAAKFGKAMAYRSMNLNNQSLAIFNEIRRKHPQSPEYFRAETEMKLV
ncbi:MAG TPA: tetratricopeptide repeat protein, partial [Parachlamydiaceae bacterium]|nr:tetratricopeptide repeat protein [Parachlamydiaceae bacterium]